MKTLTRYRWAALACLGFLLPASALAQPETRAVDLRPKFERGQSTRFKMEVTNTSSTQNPPPTKPPPGGVKPSAADQLRSKIEFGLSLKVTGVSETREATVDLVFDSLKLSTKNKDQTVEFDSTKPSGDGEDIGAMLFQGLVGSTLTLKVDKNGNITSVSGGEAFSALGQFLGEGGGGGGGKGAGQLFGPLFSIKSGNGMATIGESWENIDQVDNSMLGKFKMTTKHTLRSVLGSDAMVDVVGRIEPSSEEPSSGVAQVKNSRYGGRYSWDTTLGMLRQMDTTMSVDLEQNVAGVKSTTRNESVVKVTRVK